jgi:hypothetical protein
MKQQQSQDIRSLTQLRMGMLGAITAVFVCFGLSFALSGQVSSVEAKEANAPR